MKHNRGHTIMTKLITTMILAFLPIMPIIDVEKFEAKIRRQRLGIHGEDSDSDSESEDEESESEDSESESDIASKDTKDRKNPKDTSLWKKLWDWLFGSF